MPANPRYNDAWSEFFTDNPDILASWGHQNGYPPPGDQYRHLYTAPADPQSSTDSCDDDDEEYYQHG